MFIDSGEGSAWTGYHSYLDGKLGMSSDDYAMSLTKKFIKGKGFIVLDLKKDIVMKELNKLASSKQCIIGFITPDGREILTNTQKNQIFHNLSYFKKSQNNKVEKGSSYETYNGDKYLYLYAKLENSKAMITCLIPQKVILKQVDSIKILTIIVVLFASIVAVGIGVVYAMGINKVICKIIQVLDKAKEGDLTVSCDMNRKDEFLTLSNGIELRNNSHSLEGAIKSFRLD